VTAVDTGSAPNGATEDAEGRIYVAQCGASSPIGAGGDLGREGGIQIIERDGTVSWLTTAPTSPNDLCIGPDGWVWCTDPTRPMGSNSGRLWRCDPESGRAEQLATMDWYPNGIGFGPDDDLFVAHTSAQQILRYPVLGDRLGEGEVVVQLQDGHPDGFTFDVDGNLVIAAVQFSGAAGTIQRWGPDGRLLDVVHPGDAPVYANVALDSAGMMAVTGSSEGTVLRITGCPWAGLPLHPFR
jgi:gluconolactonase